MFPHVGVSQIVLILIVIVLLFGRKKLPEVGKNLGKAIRNFKRSMDEPDEIDITPKSAEKPEEKKNKS